MWGIVVCMWFVGIIAIFIKLLSTEDGTTQNNENAIGMAADMIEIAERMVKKYQYLLGCNIVTMWQLGNEGAGFIIEFYGFDVADVGGKKVMEDALDNCIGQWKVEVIENDLHIRCNFNFSYEGSWRKFNKDVWNEVERRHSDWNVKEVNSNKSVLEVNVA